MLYSEAVIDPKCLGNSCGLGLDKGKDDDGLEPKFLFGLIRWAFVERGKKLILVVFVSICLVFCPHRILKIITRNNSTCEIFLRLELGFESF